jgi:hypothetical protein
MSRLRLRRARERLHGDEGGALVEFLGVTVLLLVPIVYGVVAVSQVQAATYAVEGASRAAARGAAIAALDVVDAGGTPAQASAAAASRADAVVDLTFDDFDVRGKRSLELTCVEGCTGPGSQVIADVSVAVPLPGIPGPIAAVLPLEVTVSATGASAVEPGALP